MRYIMEARAQAISTIATIEDDYYNKGKIEGKLELARELYKDGVAIEKIIEKTGFTAEQIKNE